MTRVHLIKVVFDLSQEKVTNHQWKDQKILPLLTQLLKVYALKQLLNDYHDLLITGFLTKPQVRLMRDSYN